MKFVLFLLGVTAMAAAAPIPHPLVVDGVDRGVCMPPECTPLHPAQYAPSVTVTAIGNPIPTPTITIAISTAPSAERAHIVPPSAENPHVDCPENPHVDCRNPDCRADLNLDLPSADGNWGIGIGAPPRHIAPRSYPNANDGNWHIGAPSSSSSSAETSCVGCPQVIAVEDEHATGTSAENASVGVPAHGVSAEGAHVSVAATPVVV
ncbi:MAG: hypothetical protein Q9223_005921 [Gallowayella weberi]